MALRVGEWDDPASWNEFAASVPHPHFQQSWAWGDLAPELGGRALRLAAVRDGAIEGAMQIFVNPLSRTGKTHLYVPRGPAVRSPRPQLLAPLFDRAAEEGRKRSAVGIRIEPNAPARDSGWESALGPLGFHTTYPPSQPRS